MPENYFKTKELTVLPRLPLKGSIDLTYRCNNHCIHCWLRTDSVIKELTKEEIVALVDEARALGCREWAISGGEPMLRPDFPEIFDYITSHSKRYSLNTNGTLITPEIAELMKRKGNKMVAIYGATSEVHDHITGNQGSFDATMRGFSLLKKAGAGFIVQIVPMRDNYHQIEEMKALAKSLSPDYRIGAAWLYLSADGRAQRNEEINAQRLPPQEVVKLDLPNISKLGFKDESENGCPAGDLNLFDKCISIRRDFHIDPYGMMSFCSFIKDPEMRYDLMKGSLREGWEDFIPSLIGKIKGDTEYLENCGQCDYRKDCRWCPVYGYLEKRSYSAPVGYLCDVAKEMRACKERMERDNIRYYSIGGITIRVESDIPFSENTFHPKFEKFRVDGPGEDNVVIRHHFGIPDFPIEERGIELYRKSPWAIYRKDQSWIYTGLPSNENLSSPYRIAVFSNNYSLGKIYNDQCRENNFKKGNIHSLTMFPTDQIFIAKLLEDRNGFILHSCSVIINEIGLIFIGHSGAGKSTLAKMMKPYFEILCDDRNIVRRNSNGWELYGTWSHGDVPDISANFAPLNGIFFIEKSESNRIDKINDYIEIRKRLLEHIIRPLTTNDWWCNTLNEIEIIIKEIPFFIMKFNKNGDIISILKNQINKI